MDDEEVGAFINTIATATPETFDAKHFQKRVVGPLHHNNRLYQQVVTDARKVTLSTPAGIIYGEAYETKWNAAAHSRVMERTVRGLYFHHFSQILPSTTEFTIRVYDDWPDKLWEMSKKMKQAAIGVDRVIYRYAMAQEQPTASVWLFQFYKAHLVFVSTDDEHNKAMEPDA